MIKHPIHFLIVFNFFIMTWSFVYSETPSFSQGPISGGIIIKASPQKNIKKKDYVTTGSDSLESRALNSDKCNEEELPDCLDKKIKNLNKNNSCEELEIQASCLKKSETSYASGTYSDKKPTSQEKTRETHSKNTSNEIQSGGIRIGKAQSLSPIENEALATYQNKLTCNRNATYSCSNKLKENLNCRVYVIHKITCLTNRSSSPINIEQNQQGAF